jgi:hypothetical protein
MSVTDTVDKKFDRISPPLDTRLGVNQETIRAGDKSKLPEQFKIGFIPAQVQPIGQFMKIGTPPGRDLVSEY